MKRWIIFILIMLCISSINISAQDNGTHSPIFDTHFVNRDSIQWSHDSQSLVFRVLNDDDSTFTYYQYDVEMGELEQNPDDLPFMLQLTEEEQEHFHSRYPQAYVDAQGQTIIYISEFEIYTQGSPNLRELFAIGERSLGVYTIMQTLPVSDFLVRWNDEGGIALIELHSPYSPATFVYYVRPESAFYHTMELEIARFDSNTTIFDFSSEGSQVLLPVNLQRDLYLWQVPATIPFNSRYYEPANDRLLIAENNVAGAAFIPDDDENILILNTEGIVRYNVNTEATLVLNNNINSMWAQWASFSPNNDYVVVVNDGVLYVLPTEANNE